MSKSCCTESNFYILLQVLIIRRAKLCVIPDGVLIQPGPPDDEHLLLETCRSVEINTSRKSASIWSLTRIRKVISLFFNSLRRVLRTAYPCYVMYIYFFTNWKAHETS